MIGRLDLEYETPISPAERFVEFDVQRFSTGIYTMMVVTDEQEIVKSFVIGE